MGLSGTSGSRRQTTPTSSNRSVGRSTSTGTTPSSNSTTRASMAIGSRRHSPRRLSQRSPCPLPYRLRSSRRRSRFRFRCSRVFKQSGSVDISRTSSWRQPAQERRGYPPSTTSRLRRAGYERLLFVAHRDEILRQSQDVFRLVLGDTAFGERHAGSERPAAWAHVFASIQSLHRVVDSLQPDQFDVVIVDEFHHAEADTYRTTARPAVAKGATWAHCDAGAS